MKVLPRLLGDAAVTAGSEMGLVTSRPPPVSGIHPPVRPRYPDGMSATDPLTPDPTTGSLSDAASEVPRAVNFAKAKRWRLIWLLVFSIAIGVAEQVFVKDELDKVFRVGGARPTAVLIASWCHIDARERGYAIRKLLFLAIVFVTVVGLPIYLIRTRGFRGVLSIVFALLFAIIMAVLEGIAIEITYRLM
jgi:hypothetical protein